MAPRRRPKKNAKAKDKKTLRLMLMMTTPSWLDNQPILFLTRLLLMLDLHDL